MFNSHVIILNEILSVGTNRYKYVHTHTYECMLCGKRDTSNGVTKNFNESDYSVYYYYC